MTVLMIPLVIFPVFFPINYPECELSRWLTHSVIIRGFETFDIFRFRSEKLYFRAGRYVSPKLDELRMQGVASLFEFEGFTVRTSQSMHPNPETVFCRLRNLTASLPQGLFTLWAFSGCSKLGVSID